jgi:hypothetical protein
MAASLLLEMEELAARMRAIIVAQPPHDLLGYIQAQRVMGAMFESDAEHPEEADAARSDLINDSQELPKIVPLLGKHAFVSLSIDDLFVLRRFLLTAGEFVHYMEVRQAVAGLRGAHLFDELDHLGAYTKGRLVWPSGPDRHERWS